MRSHLGVPLGRPVDVLIHPSGSRRPELAPSSRLRIAVLPPVTSADSHAVAEIAHDRPDLALALQKLAGIDPEQRQAQYEAIRREVLKIRDDGPVTADVNADASGGSASGGLAGRQGHPEEPAAPPKIKPLSAQAVILQAYQQVSKLETPTSLLSIPSA